MLVSNPIGFSEGIIRIIKETPKIRHSPDCK